MKQEKQTQKGVGGHYPVSLCIGLMLLASLATSAFSQVLTHRYSFNEAAGAATFADSVGTANGTVYGAASLDGSGNLVLPGASDGGSYAELPPHLIDGYTALTFECWVQFGANPNWGRLVDFGDSNPSTKDGRYCIDFTPHSDKNGINFEVSDADPGFSHVQVVAGPPVLDNGSYHLALVYNPAGGSMSVYTNGVLMGRNSNVTIPISALTNSHSWLGKSSYLNDPNGVATIDEFRIYNGVLSDLSIAINAASGPTNYIADPGALTNLHLLVPSPIYAGQIQVQPVITGDYQNIKGVHLEFGATLQSGNTSILVVGNNSKFDAKAPGTTTLVASYGGVSVTQTVAVLDMPAVLTHRYSFNEAAGATTFADSVGTANGAVYGAASLDGGGNLVLPGGTFGDNYAELPPQLIDGYAALTFECWVQFGANPNWGRLVDFGDSNPSTSLGRYCIDFTPHSGNNPNGLNFEVSDADPGFNHVQVVASPPVLDNGSYHLALVYNPVGRSMSVYTNGALMGQNTNVTIPMSAIVNSHSWLGKSSYLNDPNGAASIDEFRIYNGALTPSQVAIDAAAGPNKIVANPGSLLAVHIAVSENQTGVGGTLNSTVTGDYTSVSGVNLLNYGAPVAFASSNTNVATVDATGKIKATGPGTTAITASVGSLSASQTITVLMLPTVMIHRYSFNADGATVASDSLNPGGAWDGTLNGGATISGGQVVLDPIQSSYVQLPSGILSNNIAVTLEFWASFNTEGVFCKLYSIGNTDAAGAGYDCVELTPHSGNGWNDTRMAIADGDPGFNHEQDVVVPGTLDGQTNVHLVAVYDPAQGYDALFINGALAGINTNVTIPMSHISSVLGYLGKSLYNGDNYFSGSIDELRIYSGPLTAAQVALDAAAGPNNIVTNPGALKAVHVVVVTNTMLLGLNQHASAVGDFANISNVNLVAYGSQITFACSNPNVLTIDAAGHIRAVGAGTATITATVGAIGGSQIITVVLEPVAMTHRYSFNEAAGSATFADSVGTANGMLYGSASLDGNGHLVLPGGSGGNYAELPANLIDGYTALTFEFWVQFGANPNWGRLVDFGDSNPTTSDGRYCIDFTPHSDKNGINFEVSDADPGFNHVQVVAGPPVLDKGSYHLVLVYDPAGGSMSIYTNGVLMGRNNNVTIPMSAIVDSHSWLGKSSYLNDPNGVATIDEFRIYNGPLLADQIRADYLAGANALGIPSLQVSLAGGNVVVSWPAWAAVGKLESAASLSGSTWSPVTNNMVLNGSYQVTLPASATARFFRLTQ